jgi:hypothetical protein
MEATRTVVNGEHCVVENINWACEKILLPRFAN